MTKELKEQCWAQIKMFAPKSISWSHYDLAVQTNGQLLPTFKFGTTESPVYHKFESLEDLRDFYISVMSYVTDTLATGWQEKDKIDWTVYEDLLK